MTNSPFGGVDMARVMYGENARHVPAWMYVQDAGDGIVSIVGASRVDSAVHPLRYGSQRPHQLIVGELVVRPHLVVATDALRGNGISDLAMNNHTLDELLHLGEVVLDPIGRLAHLRREGW